jgi:heme ABC exporter ATP-binding subunit CcmA
MLTVSPTALRGPEARVPTVVRCRRVVCLLGGFPVLAGVDLDVDAGEVVVLTGPNGAGKTTLLRLLAGLLPAARGEVEVLGHDLVADRRAHRHLVALVGHEPGVYDDLTVAENLRLRARALGTARDRVDAALARAGLDACAAVPAGRLSAGQRRRVALAGAWLADAPLVLLDEPHAALDADGRARLDTWLAQAVADGRTLLVATHEPGRLRHTGAREVAMIGGQTRAAAGTAR